MPAVREDQENFAENAAFGRVGEIWRLLRNQSRCFCFTSIIKSHIFDIMQIRYIIVNIVCYMNLCYYEYEKFVLSKSK